MGRINNVGEELNNVYIDSVPVKRVDSINENKNTVGMEESWMNQAKRGIHFIFANDNFKPNVMFAPPELLAPMKEEEEANACLKIFKK